MIAERRAVHYQAKQLRKDFQNNSVKEKKNNMQNVVGGVKYFRRFNKMPTDNRSEELAMKVGTEDF